MQPTKDQDQEKAQWYCVYQYEGKETLQLFEGVRSLCTHAKPHLQVASDLIESTWQAWTQGQPVQGTSD
jgi:hypothetical protein